VAVALGLSPGSSLADVSPPPGVHIDPGSPASKEYQIPIPAARQETSGAASAGGSSNPPLFGVGIVTPRPAVRTASRSGAALASAAARSRSRSSATGATRAGAQHKSSARTRHAGASSDPRRAAGAPRRADLMSGDPGSTGWLPLVGGGAVVLILGGGGGLALRRKYLPS
jgi:hypothetical protein